MKLKYGLAYPTWQGIYLGGIFIALCIAAMTRQINLLLFIAGLILGPMILSWFMVKIKKGWFKVQRRMPVTIHAESEFVLSLDLTNVSRGTLFALAARQTINELRVASCELRGGEAPLPIRSDRVGSQVEAGSAENSFFGSITSSNRPCGFAPAREAIIAPVGRFDSLATPNYFFSRLKPNEKLTREFVCQIDRPGEYRLEPVELISRFPLGLFECRVRVGRAATFWVYPALLDDLPEDLIQLTAQSWDGVSRETNHSSRNVGDFHSVTAYRPGEDVRLIHWRSSARLGDLVIRQFQPPLGAWLGIVVDMTPPDDWEEKESNDLPEKIQHNIKLAATVVYRLCSKTAEYSGRETQIVLALTSDPDNIISGRADSNFFHQAMQTLASAQLDNSGQNKTAETVSAVRELVPDGTKVVVL
ncbi:MAG: DUF58 domain-containing protein [Thermoguttaceae bacterium]|nr:DUF58 domain-containing protein [Thermoguttaceae bacterium]